jgi:hypothetical protein
MASKNKVLLNDKQTDVECKQKSKVVDVSSRMRVDLLIFRRELNGMLKIVNKALGE